MLKQVVSKVIGSRFDRELKKIQPIIDRIHERKRSKPRRRSFARS
jgi:hypothetical protein